MVVVEELTQGRSQCEERGSKERSDNATNVNERGQAEECSSNASDEVGEQCDER